MTSVYSQMQILYVSLFAKILDILDCQSLSLNLRVNFEVIFEFEFEYK